MHGAHNTCQKCMHTLSKKCIWTRAYAPMQQCRSFFAMEAIANLFWVLREYCAGCRLSPALAAPPAVSTKPVTWRCSLKKPVQIHASSWRGRRCGVAQASFNHPRWCRPHRVCLWVVLALGRGSHCIKNSISAIFSRKFRVAIWKGSVWRTPARWCLTYTGLVGGHHSYGCYVPW